MNRFVKSLSTAWREGEVRPTHRRTANGPRAWRTRVDPFEDTWSLVEEWLNQQPDATAKELFHRLQEQAPNQFAAGQLRTLQRQVKQWRTEIARQLVLGSGIDNAEQRNTRTKEKEDHFLMGALCPPTPQDLSLTCRADSHQPRGRPTRPSLVWPLSQRSVASLRCHIPAEVSTSVAGQEQNNHLLGRWHLI